MTSEISKWDLTVRMVKEFYAQDFGKQAEEVKASDVLESGDGHIAVALYSGEVRSYWTPLLAIYLLDPTEGLVHLKDEALDHYVTYQIDGGDEQWLPFLREVEHQTMGFYSDTLKAAA